MLIIRSTISGLHTGPPSSTDKKRSKRVRFAESMSEPANQVGSLLGHSNPTPGSALLPTSKQGYHTNQTPLKSSLSPAAQKPAQLRKQTIGDDSN